MRQGAIGKGGERRLNETAARSEDAGFPTLPVSLHIIDDDLAPGQTIAEYHRANGVAYRIFGTFEDVRGNILVAKIHRVFGQGLCLVHGSLLSLSGYSGDSAPPHR